MNDNRNGPIRACCEGNSVACEWDFMNYANLSSCSPPRMRGSIQDCRGVLLLFNKIKSFKFGRSLKNISDESDSLCFAVLEEGTASSRYDVTGQEMMKSR